MGSLRCAEMRKLEDDAFKHVEAMIGSMIKDERKSPSILNGSRRNRVARGSRRTV